MEWLIIGIVIVCVAAYFLFTSYEKKPATPGERVGTIHDDKYSPDMNRFAARRQRKVAASRADLLNELGRESAGVASMNTQKAAEIQSDFDLKEAPVRAEEARRQEQIAHDLFMQLSQEASDERIDVATLIEVKKKRLMDEAERTHQAQLKQQAILLGLIAKHLQDHQAIAQLQVQLDGLYIAIAEIEAGTYNGQLIPPAARPKMIADREKDIAAIKKDKHGRRQRLLQAYNGKNRKRTDKDSDLR